MLTQVVTVVDHLYDVPRLRREMAVVLQLKKIIITRIEDHRWRAPRGRMPIRQLQAPVKYEGLPE